jgi:hypothetical protein
LNFLKLSLWRRMVFREDLFLNAKLFAFE